jgi:hypothetical protein
MTMERVEVAVRLRVDGLAMADAGGKRRLVLLTPLLALLLLLPSSGVSGVTLLDERSSFLVSRRCSFL